MATNNDASIENDFMYQSLIEMRKRCPKYQRRIVKSARKLDMNRKITKQLSSVLNNFYYTSGNTNEEDNNIQRIEDTRKKISEKSVTKVDYDEKTLIQSNVISIDIEAASTFLPLMCKLIIISDGAVVERGQCLLVRDVNTQVSDEEPKAYTNKNLKIRCSSVIEQRQNQSSQTDPRHESFQRASKSHLNETNNQFSQTNNLYRKNSETFESFDQDSIEFWSIPYYQYQKKNFKKKDFSINTTESDIFKSFLDEWVPEYSRKRIPSYRNEMFMVVNDNKKSPNIIKSDFSNTSFISERYRIKRSYIEERFSKFEAEVVISDRKQTEKSIPIINCTSSSNSRINETENEILVNYQKPLSNNDSRQKTRSQRSSVTSLIMMQLKNGRIIE